MWREPEVFLSGRSVRHSAPITRATAVLCCRWGTWETTPQSQLAARLLSFKFKDQHDVTLQKPVCRLDMAVTIEYVL